MTMIHDRDGTELADIPLSEKQQSILETGEEIVVFYHTPQLLRHVLGERAGVFTLSLSRNAERIITSDSVALKKYADLQRAIKVAREQA